MISTLPPIEDFNRNVFINCPFDDEYKPLLNSLIFCILFLNFEPQIALIETDSGQPRIEKIKKLILKSQYSIHDLSRCIAKKEGEIFRLNMPFELGVDIGCKWFLGNDYQSKKCLILEEEKYRYQAAISDLSNSDIKYHSNEPEELTYCIRDWFSEISKNTLPSGSKIWNSYNEYCAFEYDTLTEKDFSEKDITRLSLNERISLIRQYLSS